MSSSRTGLNIPRIPSADRPRRSGRQPPRTPALAVLAAAMLGILLAELLLQQWFTLGQFCLMAAVVAITHLVHRYRTSGWTTSFNAAAVPVLLVTACAFGTWHYTTAAHVAPDDVSSYLRARGSARVKLQTALLEEPHRRVYQGQSGETEVVTQLLLQVHSVWRNGSWQPASGRVRCRAAGELSDVAIGQTLEIDGELTWPRQPLNPGDFDERAWLLGRGIRAVLQSRVELIRPIKGSLPPWAHWSNWRHAGRGALGQLFEARLSQVNAPIARSMFLGDPMDGNAELREAFAHSGTMHVLAISGVNIAILATVLGAVLLQLRLPDTAVRVGVLASVALYASLTSLEPSVVRATCAALVVGLASLLGRRMSIRQGLSLGGLVILILNPGDLFRVGTQLTFLAVLVLGELWSVNRWHAGELEWPSWRQNLAWLWRVAMEATILGLWLNIVLTPLIAYHFQLYAPVGVLANVLLSPLVWLTLVVGYLLLLVGWLPVVGVVLGTLLDGLLTCLIQGTQFSADWSGGHAYGPGPTGWWLAGFYGGVVAVCLATSVRTKWRWGCAVGLWTAAGLGLALLPGATRDLECRVVSVGHGLAIVLRMPNGSTLLYDAGAYARPQGLEGSIQRAMWATGARRLSALVLSHRDSDHYNLVPGLLDRVPIGEVYVSAGFVRNANEPPDPRGPARDPALPITPGWNLLLSELYEAQIPVRMLATGHELRLDPEVSIRVLHPRRHFVSNSDNAHSVVLLVEYRSRRILLTGDLEKGGLEELLNSPREPADVLLSPHHGSPAANPRALAEWASPLVIVASTSEGARAARLREVYDAAGWSLATARDGQTTIRISADGELTVETYRAGPRPTLAETPAG